MSDKLSRRIEADIEAERVKPVRLAPTLDDRLRAEGFKPTRLARQRTDHVPLAVTRPGLVYVTLDETGLKRIEPGLVEALNPPLDERIGSVADGIRRVGVPVVIILVDRTPVAELATDAE
jgi:hypothetical protein